MKIKEITYQNRRDFKAIFVCEFCENEVEQWGYDDDNFHRNVIPEKKCPVCSKSVIENGDELHEEYRALSTKYPPHLVV